MILNKTRHSYLGIDLTNSTFECPEIPAAIDWYQRSMPLLQSRSRPPPILAGPSENASLRQATLPENIEQNKLEILVQKA
jgi:hypothetical protein